MSGRPCAAIGCGVVVIAMALIPVAAGQARPGHATTRAGAGALAPVTFTSTGAEQTYTVPGGVTSLQVQLVGANGGSDENVPSELFGSWRRGWDGDR